MIAWTQLKTRLQHLPRETRDTFFLLFTIAATALPHADHLPLWCSALTALMLFWRGLLAWRGQALPGRWSLTLMLVVTAGLTLLTHRTLLGREAGITMLVMLMAMKTLELRARRDAFVVFFLGFFLVLTQYLYSQSLLTALWTLVTVWALLSALVLAQMPVGQPSLKLAALQAARTTAIGLPVMVLLFVLFPRVAPLWGVPSDSVGRTGLSNEMQLGAMSEIANDESIAMRLRFEGAAPPPQALYFRGPVLARFDGRSWRPLGPGSPFFFSGLAPRVQGQALRYELTMEPLRLPVLPLLESSPEAPGSAMDAQGLTLRRANDLQWLAPRPITERLRVQQVAYLDFNSGPLRATPGLQPYLELPQGLNPRTLAWAAELRDRPAMAALADEAVAPALVAAVLQHIASADFTYTLAPGRYGEVTPHLIDEFWFDRRLGFCEHFAAGFVVVMRAMGIPARVVTGFQGTDPEPQDGYLVVRNSQAHAWAEVWQAGRGWVRVDPTAAVAPERVSLGRTLQPAPGAFAGALGQVNPALWRGLRAIGRGWEALNNRWQQYVLNYSRNDQFDLLKNMGWRNPDWQALGQLAAALIAGIAGAGAAWAAWTARPHDAWSQQREAILRELRRLDVAAKAHQAPRQWAALLQARHGAAAAPLTRQLLALELARYAAAGNQHAPGLMTRWRWLREFRAAGRMLQLQTPKTPSPLP
jgi:transglutaminase-like putative cysteine protease